MYIQDGTGFMNTQLFENPLKEFSDKCFLKVTCTKLQSYQKNSVSFLDFHPYIKDSHMVRSDKRRSITLLLCRKYQLNWNWDLWTTQAPGKTLRFCKPNSRKAQNARKVQWRPSLLCSAEIGYETYTLLWLQDTKCNQQGHLISLRKQLIILWKARHRQGCCLAQILLQEELCDRMKKLI